MTDQINNLDDKEKVAPKRRQTVKEADAAAPHGMSAKDVKRYGLDPSVYGIKQ